MILIHWISNINLNSNLLVLSYFSILKKYKKEHDLDLFAFFLESDK
jgi:hypothetical protein